MAKKGSTEAPVPERIVDVDVSEEMRTSFLSYAYSVIYSRALPDARDGLKPVQRRILFQMSQMGLRPDRGHVKSARVVGEVMGRLHPHGEGAIYDALVRMAQPFSFRLPFVDGHGNFGSVDDGPAAMRYTECRLAPAALAMTTSIDEDVVDFAPNYDGRELEPEVLPAAIPALLVNGTTGIAVGMATNMAPHNLAEVVAAAKHLVKHPNATLDSIMRFVPGPDLPTGGRIVGLGGIRDAYATGRGAFRIRASATIEQITPRRQGIVVTELPYNVGIERVMEKIKDLHQAKKIQGVAALTDLTDGEKGTRLVIEVKSGFNAEALLEQLYKLTPLEESFSINAVALVHGRPRTLGLIELLRVFLDHRFEVVRRRSEYRRRNAMDRLHLVDGMLIAILDIDEVIQLIRSSDNTSMARARLMEVFDLSEAQTNYILEMPLRRLTKFSRLELETEAEQLKATIAELTEILEDDAKLRAVVSAELTQVATEHGTPRRTVLLESAGTPSVAAAPLEVADEPCWVLLGSAGLLARTKDAARPNAEGPRASHDAITGYARATARGHVGVVTSSGRLHRVSVLELPALPDTQDSPHLAGGAPLSEYVSLDHGERVVGLVSLDDAGGFALGTKQGVVKRVALELLNKDVWEVIRLKDGDSVVSAADATDSDDLVFVTSDASLLRFGAAKVKPQGRAGGGVAGVSLSASAEVVGFDVVDPAAVAQVITVADSAARLPGTASGSVKVSAYADFPAKGRSTGGVRCQRFLKGEDVLVLARVAAAPLRAVGPSGTPVALPGPLAKRDASGEPVEAPIAAVGGALPGSSAVPVAPDPAGE